jgi:hypothetical protein
MPSGLPCPPCRVAHPTVLGSRKCCSRPLCGCTLRGNACGSLVARGACLPCSAARCCGDASARSRRVRHRCCVASIPRPARIPGPPACSKACRRPLSAPNGGGSLARLAGWCPGRPGALAGSARPSNVAAPPRVRHPVGGSLEGVARSHMLPCPAGCRHCPGCAASWCGSTGSLCRDSASSAPATALVAWPHVPSGVSAMQGCSNVHQRFLANGR